MKKPKSSSSISLSDNPGSSLTLNQPKVSKFSTATVTTVNNPSSMNMNTNNEPGTNIPILPKTIFSSISMSPETAANTEVNGSQNIQLYPTIVETSYDQPANSTTLNNEPELNSSSNCSENTFRNYSDDFANQ